MLNKFLQKIKIWFKSNNPTSLELYIESKKPTNLAEVEFYTVDYFRKGL